MYEIVSLDFYINQNTSIVARYMTAKFDINLRYLLSYNYMDLNNSFLHKNCNFINLEFLATFSFINIRQKV